MSCRTQGGISRCPSFRPPPWPSKPQFCSLRPDFGPLSHQIIELKSALRTSYMPSRPQISPPDLKSALQASNQTFRPQICPLGLKPAPQTSNLLFWAKSCHPNFKSASGRLEIHPCVLQDIGPLGPLPCSHSTTSLDHSKQGIGYRLPCVILE